jgi:hypothetical protein
MPFCSNCSTSIEKRKWIGHLRSNVHKKNCSEEYMKDVYKVSSAFRSRIVTYKIVANNDTDNLLPEEFLKEASNKVLHLINDAIRNHTSVKVNFELYGLFYLCKNDAQEIKMFSTKNITIHTHFDFENIYTAVIEDLMRKIESFQHKDSGWSFLSNSHLELNINKYDPMRGSGFIELPGYIKNKKACINVKNKDNFCFLWSVIADLYPAERNANRVTSYPHFKDVLNIKGLSFPVNFSDIPVFERYNDNISINVYGFKNRRVIGPLYKSQFKRKHKINLLLLEKNEQKHYCLIKNLSRLVRNQITKHHGALHFCEDCLLFFSSTFQLKKHNCTGVATVIPKPGSSIKFNHYERKQTVPFVIYADAETLLETYQGCDNDPSKSDTFVFQKHVPVAFAYKLVCSYDENLNDFVSYRGRDCVPIFVQSLYEKVENISKILRITKPMIFTESDCEAFSNAYICYVCQGLLWEGNKVRDHCHLTGKYRGAAHSQCNLKLQVSRFLPVFFHNLSGYDCHLFIKELCKTPGDVKLIPKSMEKYISFTKYVILNDTNECFPLRFVDSFKFLGSSLDNLAKSMNRSDFYHLQKSVTDANQFELLLRKGIYPYEHMKTWQSYEEKKLPHQDKFFSSITNEVISETQYQHAKLIWDTFKIKDMGQYTDLYLKTDVMLLTDIFEHFRKTSKTHYKLDPAFYLTLPSLSYDAMLLNTGITLELLHDFEMVRMIQSGIRGGICLCSNRYAEANNMYIDDYDTSKQDSYIVYIDCNNLYGFSMCQYLPYSGFQWLNENEIDSFQVMEISDDGLFGYILEVDIHYPDYLHTSHNDLPFCAEKMVPPGGIMEKLVPNLHNKYNYVIHYVHLKTCLKHGLELKKIHRIIKFKQSQFLKQYIDLNTDLRKKAVSQFDQDFFKLLNNSVFGKTLENVEKRVTVKLINCWNDHHNISKKKFGASELINKPNFHRISILSDDLVAIQMKPESIVLDKPIYIGFTVLELSKSHMYDFNYSVIKPYYSDRVTLLYTDTDSFVYNIKTRDFYSDLRLHLLEYFDTSNLDSNNQFNIPLKNKKVPGLFKDELSGNVIKSFVGLRSKLYCITTNNKLSIKKAKGVKTPVVRDLSTSDYTNVLLSDQIIRRKQVLFKSIKHELFTQIVNKVALCNKDDKRFINNDKISTLAWGHKLIKM